MIEKVIKEAKYILDNDKTIREAASYFGISKSALYEHLTKKLKKYDYNLYLQIKNVFLEHNKVRHIKGGIATKAKYFNSD